MKGRILKICSFRYFCKNTEIKIVYFFAKTMTVIHILSRKYVNSANIVKNEKK